MHLQLTSTPRVVGLEGDGNYAGIEYDDSGWGTATVPHDWRQPPLNYKAENAVGWYRREVSATQVMEDAALRGQLYLALGTVSATDKTYLNGQLIGSTGSDSNPTCGNYLVNRNYQVAFCTSMLHRKTLTRW